MITRADLNEWALQLPEEHRASVLEKLLAGLVECKCGAMITATRGTGSAGELQDVFGTIDNPRGLFFWHSACEFGFDVPKELPRGSAGR